MNITLLGREANLIVLHLFGWKDKNVMQGERLAGKSVHLQYVDQLHILTSVLKRWE